MTTIGERIIEKINEEIRRDCLNILEQHANDGEDIMLGIVVAAIRARHGDDGLQIRMARAVAAAVAKGDDAA